MLNKDSQRILMATWWIAGLDKKMIKKTFFL